jgi:predicted tellurium resistance membrane protein TerC
MIFFFRFLITTLFLILIYTVYRSEIYWLGSNRSYYLIYYIGILLAIVFSIIFIYLNVKIQKYIIIIFISTILALYFFEGKLIFDKKEINLNFDRRTKFEVYEDLKKLNSNITLSVSPHNFISFTKDLLT